MELSEMTLKDVEERISSLDKEVAEMNAVEDIDKATDEKKNLLERKKELDVIEKRKQIALDLTAGKIEPEKVIEERKVEKNMETKTLAEVRASQEYVDAFAKYIKTEDDTECRALLSKNAISNGTVPVPTVVDETIRTAWEKEEIMALVNTTNLRGNVQIGFELSATGAVVHEEGSSAPAEEVLTFGIVTMIPKSIKKWITISDETLDLTNEAFLQYIYSEVTYQIAKKCAEILIGIITTLPTAATATSVSADEVTAAPVIGTVAEVIGHLSDEASNPVITINKLTWSQFKKSQYNNKFNVDPFEGLDVKFSSALPSYDNAGAGDVWMIVGDYGRGAQANYPNGSDMNIKFDDMSLAEKDLVKVVGRRYVSLGCVRDKAFVNVVKPE